MTLNFTSAYRRFYNGSYNPCLHAEQLIGEELAHKIREHPNARFYVDTFATLTHSFVVGMFLDSQAGLTITGSLWARFTANFANTAVGGIYGRLRDSVFTRFAVKPDETGLKRHAVELIPYLAVHTTKYGAMVALGDLMSTGEINPVKVASGMAFNVLLSPFNGPSLGWFTDQCRSFFLRHPADLQRNKALC